MKQTLILVSLIFNEQLYFPLTVIINVGIQGKQRVINIFNNVMSRISYLGIGLGL